MSINSNDSATWKQDSIIEKMRRFLFGDDIFISYSHVDSTYALSLANELTKRNLSCFLDQWGTPPGEELPEELISTIKRCSTMVLVGSKNAAESENVGAEVNIFLEKRRPIIPITFVEDSLVANAAEDAVRRNLTGTLEQAKWYSTIAGIAKTTETLKALKTTIPSENIILRIVKATEFRSRSKRLRRAFLATLVITGFILGSGVFAVYSARKQVKDAQKAADEATKRSVEKTEEANNATSLANEKTEEANKATLRADSEATRASKQEKRADEKTEEANNAAEEAKKQTAIASEKTKIADAETIRANKETQKATVANNQADEAMENEKIASRATYTELGRQYLNNNYPFRAAIYLNKAYEMSPRNEDPSKISSLRFLLGLSMKSVESLLFTVEYEKEDVVYAKFSPDSQQVAIAGADDIRETENTVRVLNVETGEEDTKPIQHGFDVNTAEFSPDGTKIITSSDDHTARLFDFEKGKVSSIFKHKNDVKSAKFSLDGNQIATIDSDHVATIWDIRTGEETFSKKIHEIISAKPNEKTVEKVEFSPNIKQIMIVDDDYNLKVHGVTIYDIETGKATRCFEHTDTINSVKFSPDGTQIVTASDDKTAVIFDLKTKKVTSLQHLSSVHSAGFSPDGNRIVTVSSNYMTASVWDVKTEKPVTSVQHSGNIRSARFSPDGKQIVTASNDMTARVWDVETGNLLVSMEHTGFVFLAEYSPDGKKIITSSNDRKVRLWNVKNMTDTVTVPHNCSVVSAKFTFSDDSQRVVTASWDNTAKILDMKTGKIRTLMKPGCPVNCITSAKESKCKVRSAEFSRDGKQIVTGSDNAANIWDAETGNFLYSLPHSRLVASAEFSLDREHIVTANYDGTAKVWNLKTKEIVALFNHGGNVNSAKFSHDGKRIVTASDDGTAKVWDLANREKSVATVRHTKDVISAEFSPDDKQIVTASSDKTAKVWNVETDKEIASFEHRGLVISAEFSPDGRLVVTASYDNTAKIWDIANPKKPIPLSHQNRIRSAKFSPDGKQIITASDDKTAKVWDVETGNILVSMQHQDWVRLAQFSSDGRQVVTASFDNTAKVWNFPPETRSWEDIENIISKKVPFRLENRVLVDR
jgi:WD40 repeat protein